jgi:hypothetical protein
MRNSSPPKIADAAIHIGERNAPNMVAAITPIFSPDVAVPSAILCVTSPTFAAPRAQISCRAPFRVMADDADQIMSAAKTPSMYKRIISLSNVLAHAPGANE